MSGCQKLAAALLGLAILLGKASAQAQSSLQDLQQADLETLLEADAEQRSTHLQLEQALDSLELRLRTRQQLSLDTLLQASRKQLREAATELSDLQEPDTALMASAWLQQLRAMGQSLQLLLGRCGRELQSTPASLGSASLLQGLAFRAASADSLMVAVCRPGLSLGTLDRLRQLDWVRGEYRACLEDLIRLNQRFLQNVPAQSGTLLLLLYGH